MEKHPNDVVPDGAADPGPPAAKSHKVPALRLRSGGEDIVGERIVQQKLRIYARGQAQLVLRGPFQANNAVHS